MSQEGSETDLCSAVIILYLFTFFASQSLDARVSLRATEGKQKEWEGGGGGVGERPVTGENYLRAPS